MSSVHPNMLPLTTLHTTKGTKLRRSRHDPLRSSSSSRTPPRAPRYPIPERLPHLLLRPVLFPAGRPRMPNRTPKSRGRSNDGGISQRSRRNDSGTVCNGWRGARTLPAARRGRFRRNGFPPRGKTGRIGPGRYAHPVCRARTRKRRSEDDKNQEGQRARERRRQ